MSKHLAELCTLLVDETHGHLPSVRPPFPARTLDSDLLENFEYMFRTSSVTDDESQRLFSILINQGRLPLPLLIQRSRLPPRYVKAGLAILVQHHLVLYFNSDDDNVTTYEAHVRNAYDLIRSGKSIYILQNSLGDTTAAIPETLLVTGSSLASEVAAEHPQNTDSSLPHVNGFVNGEHLTNGHCKDITETSSDDQVSQTKASAFHASTSTFGPLFTERYLIRSRQLDHMPQYDYDYMIEHSVLEGRYAGGLRGRDQKESYADDVREEKRRMADDNRIRTDEFIRQQPKTQRKRSADELELDQKSDSQHRKEEVRPQKQRKLNRGKGYDPKASKDKQAESDVAATGAEKAGEKEVTENGSAPTMHDIEPENELALRINREKLDVALRNDKLITLSAHSLGEVPAKVYRALLRCIESRLKRCFDIYQEVNDAAGDDDDGLEGPSTSTLEAADVSPSVATAAVLEQLEPGLDLAGFLDPAELKTAKIQVEADNDPAPFKEKKNGFRNTIHDAGGAVRSLSRLEHVKQILGILEQHPLSFVHRTSDQGSAWRVNFPALSAAMIQVELEKFVNGRFGPLATRVVRYLQHKGRIEEKTIANSVLLPQKDVRAIMSRLQQSGLINVQEVPKDTTRQAKSTIFLWFFDQDRARRLMLNNIYKTMARFLQRMRVERTQVQSVVEKAERTDVRGHEDELLSEFDNKTLKEWQAKEEKMLVELGRLDDVVATLRDFLPAKKS